MRGRSILVPATPTAMMTASAITPALNSPMSARS